MDNNLTKVKNGESGVLTAQLDASEVGSIHLDPVPQYAPGILVIKPGETEEEHIFFRKRDSIGGTVSGLVRDITSLNGDVGRLHINTSPWESLQAAEYVNSLVEVLQRGWQAEMQVVAYASGTTFTVAGNQVARYTAGRLVRYGEDDGQIGVVVSSSYNAGGDVTTVTAKGFAVPNPIVSVEFLTAQAKGFTGDMPVFYGEDAGASDTYSITVLPKIGAYFAGMIVIFKANTANTAAATLNVNGIGAKGIKKMHDQDLETGDIEAGQIVTLVYDGTNLQMVSPIGQAQTVPVKATGAEINTGTDDAKFVTAKAVKDSYLSNVYNTLFRQALINGNFDVWERQTSFALTTADGYTADRWYIDTATTGDDKTVSRQDASDLFGSLYCARVQRPNGQTTTTVIRLSQTLESMESIKFRGKKVTLSFYARKGTNFSGASDILVAKIVTGKGTDQKLNAFTTPADAISENKTLTPAWQLFTITTTAEIASDITQIGISLSYTPVGTAGANDYFEVTQVQLNIGDIALPFMPKSFANELRACQRFYFKSYSDGVYANGADVVVGHVQGVGVDTSSVVITMGNLFPVPMRIAPTVNLYLPAGGSGAGSIRNHSAGGTTITGVSVVGVSNKGLGYISKVGGIILRDDYGMDLTADAEF